MTMSRCEPTIPLAGLALILLIILGSSACSRKSAPADEPQQAPPATDSSAAARDSATRQARNQAQFEQAIAELAARNYPRARRLFAEIIRDNPGLSGPYANLALIDFKQQQFQPALRRVDKAIELNPRNAQAFHLRAQIRLHNGEIEPARQDYERAVELDPEYLIAHYNLALLYDIYLQDIARAIEHYSIYLTLLGKPDEILQDWVNQLKNSLENG